MTHWEILDETRKKILAEIAKSPLLGKKHYLAGGTALSLQLGLRVSEDFAFFRPDPFAPLSLWDRLAELFPGRSALISFDQDTLLTQIDRVRISFFSYRRPLVEKEIWTDPPIQVPLASPLDIGLMKIVAIAQRGAKKDFYDLYWIARECGVSPRGILKGMDRKFGKKEWPAAAIFRSLCYFEDAEGEEMLPCFKECDWEAIKSFFRDFSEQLISAANELRYP